MSSIVKIEDISLRYEDLFRAPEKDGAIISVRVHKSVKEALVKIAEREGLEGVSELVRYLIAGFLMGKYQLIKPEPKVLTPPIFLNINVNKTNSKNNNDKEIEKIYFIRDEVNDIIKEALEFLENIKKGTITIKGNEYIKKLKEKVLKSMIKSLKYNLEDEYEKLKTIYTTLTTLLKIT